MPSPQVHAAGARGESEGLFGPGSLSWKVLQESVELLGGGRAILLQLAHPLVAAGVAEHSTFQRDPLGRLHRTVKMMLTIVFGDRRRAEAMLRRFDALHARVTGRLPDTAGPFPAGMAYTAEDPALKLWVHATLIDTALMTYERFVGRLSPAEQARFYEESKLLGQRLGIPGAIIPPTLHDFDRYMAEMLAGDTLRVTDTARALARAVLDPPIWIVPRTGVRLVGLITAGLLPEGLRRDFGLRWDARRQGALDALSWTIRSLLPVVPSPLRLMPQARAASRRLRRLALQETSD